MYAILRTLAITLIGKHVQIATINSRPSTGNVKQVTPAVLGAGSCTFHSQVGDQWRIYLAWNYGHNDFKLTFNL